MNDSNIIKYIELPHYDSSNDDSLKWYILNAHNIRTLRDIFIYSYYNTNISEEKLYNDMAKNIIPPPRDRWINPKVKKKKRLRLEYIHAAEYLGLIKRVNGIIKTNFDEFKEEKKAILYENEGRSFHPSMTSPNLSEIEKKSLTPIIFNYQPTQDYLKWFLNLYDYHSYENITLNFFRSNAEPIYLEKIQKNYRGSKILKKKDTNTYYLIPDLYIRLVSSVLNRWLKELEVIDRVLVMPEFSQDKRLWYMYYPIKKPDTFLNDTLLKRYLLDVYCIEYGGTANIWIPFLIYSMVNMYMCSIKSIKNSITNLYNKDYAHFYLERTSLQVMKEHGKYREAYIKVDGFYRSNLKIMI